jgi:dolichol-phosphate mannosyltransferase
MFRRFLVLGPASPRVKPNSNKLERVAEEIWGDMKIHVVIPSYKVERHILDVLPRIGREVERIWVVDDRCPNGSGKLVESKVKDKRVSVIYNEENLGVGGATIAGYSAALDTGAEIVIKIDGDGQMFPEDILSLVKPLLKGSADYVKGNRFDSVDDLRKMPKLRLLGNAALSLMSKVSSGYWGVNDPTNGFTAIHKAALERIDLGKLSKRYFFESDMLFRLNLAGAVVQDVSIPARYGDEESSLKISKVIVEFPFKHLKNQLKRIGYRYYLREWSLGSIQLISGVFLTIVGASFGISSFLAAVARQQATTAGQATFASLAIILGFQLLLSFVSYDIQTEPRNPIQGRY